MDASEEMRAGIDYPAAALEDFALNAYEWVDDLSFAVDPSHFVKDAEPYLAVVRRRFTADGWQGDGDIGLFWVPPFALPERSQIANSRGVLVWHVKQESDGTSWLLYPRGEWHW